MQIRRRVCLKYILRVLMTLLVLSGLVSHYLVLEMETELPPCIYTQPSTLSKISEEGNSRSLSSENLVLPGGWFKPAHCKPRDRVAIIVPYRNRKENLDVFLPALHAILTKQKIEYRVFLVEQVNGGPFNKGRLMNVGFVQSENFGFFDCFVFHDVDLIPEDERNIYDCPGSGPRHMSVAVSTMGYKLLYKDIFGGVGVLTKDHMKRVNGYSNSYWGWGHEDNDMYKRLRYNGYRIERRPPEIARYRMLSHKKAEPSPERYNKFTKWRKRIHTDGLSNLQYTLINLELKPLYTWILVDFLSNHTNN